MAIRSRINQYRGINAHFQSYAQHERDGWVAFHNTHITHLSEAIDRLLPPGYEVVPERSLINPDTRLRAVVIREVTPAGEAIPITRIELISPTNKVGENAIKYLAKRDATLEAGTVLVEVDYIHEIDSLIPQVPGYASGAAGAYPYTIIVSDPRPSLETGKTLIYGFHVDEAMPPIEIPLAGEERILLNFAEVYNTTFSSLSTFSNRADYSEEPVGFETYSPEDQRRIREVMEAVIEADVTGADLSMGPPAAG